jgi:hypothetical protein
VTGAFGGLTFRDFSTLDYEVDYFTRALSDDLTRGGPLMRTPRSWQSFLGYGNRRGARSQWNISFSGGRDELDGSFGTVSASVSVRPGTRWELSIAPRYTHRVTPRQYVATRSGGGAGTYFGRYIFARIARSEIVTRLRLNYTITPALTIEGYLEPFASSGRYGGFGELAAARSLDLRVYGSVPGTTITRQGDSTYTVVDGADSVVFAVPDFDIRSLRSNLVLRWEWTPGSTLYFVWQQDRSRRGIPVRDVGVGGLRDAFRIGGDQFVALKVSYWIAVR